MIQANKIELVPISKIIPNPKNRNKHSDEQIERLKEIIKYQGFRNPLIISNRSGMLVAGHGRLIAAKKLGYEVLPVVYEDFDSEEQEYAAQVSDNAIASWAELDLAGINFDLPNLGPDFNINMLGIKDFVLEPADKYGDKDADLVPEARKTTIVLGDYFQLGNHFLLCGDSTNPLHVEKLMRGNKADMVFTDPPYGLGDKWSGGTWASNPMYADAKKWDHLIEGIEQIILLAPEVIIWGGNYYELPPSRCWLAWTKTQQMETMADFELAWTNLDRPSKCWTGARNADGKREHPTQKPVALMEWGLGFGAGNNIIDTFLGSGSTLIACEKTNRKCYGMEIDPVYCQVIIDRYMKFTGRDDVYLIGENNEKTSFSELQKMRKTI